MFAVKVFNVNCNSSVLLTESYGVNAEKERDDITNRNSRRCVGGCVGMCEIELIRITRVTTTAIVLVAGDTEK